MTTIRTVKKMDHIQFMSFIIACQLIENIHSGFVLNTDSKYSFLCLERPPPHIQNVKGINLPGENTSPKALAMSRKS